MLSDASPPPSGSFEIELRLDLTGDLEPGLTSANDTLLSAPLSSAAPGSPPVPRPNDDCREMAGRSGRVSASANMILGPVPSSFVIVVWGTKLLENLTAEEPCRERGGLSGLRIPRGP